MSVYLSKFLINQALEVLQMALTSLPMRVAPYVRVIIFILNIMYDLPNWYLHHMVPHCIKCLSYSPYPTTPMYGYLPTWLHVGITFFLFNICLLYFDFHVNFYINRLFLYYLTCYLLMNFVFLGILGN